MVRTVRGITLSPEERIQAGYDTQKTQSHACSVTLPSGVSCAVAYSRTSARFHAFAFGEPLNLTQYTYEDLAGGVPDIEAKAASLAVAAFQQAQRHEQQAMRQKTPGNRTAKMGDDGPQVSARVADQLAGLYAACVRCASGTLIRIGATYKTPDGALAETRGGRHDKIRLVNGQTLVVGICNRAAQRWEEARFIADAYAARNVSTEPADIPVQETENTEEEDDEPTIVLQHREHGSDLSDG
jgi:hypothetical protein